MRFRYSLSICLALGIAPFAQSAAPATSAADRLPLALQHADPRMLSSAAYRTFSAMGAWDEQLPSPERESLPAFAPDKGTPPDRLLPWVTSNSRLGDDPEDGGFVTGQTVLAEHPGAGRAQFVALEHVAHGGLRLGQVAGDDHPFARGQSVGLDDAGSASLAEVGEGGFDFGKLGGGSGRDAVFLEHPFGADF